MAGVTGVMTWCPGLANKTSNCSPIFMVPLTEQREALEKFDALIKAVDQ